MTVAASVPAPDAEELEDAETRAVRVERDGASGLTATEILMLRGRYLRADRSALATTLVGIDPAEMSRQITSVMTPRR